MTELALDSSRSALGLKRWIAIAWRVKSELAQDHVGLISAGVAFYGLLAIFPAITAILAIGGLVLEPSEIVSQLKNLSAVVPDSAMEIITEQASAVAGTREGGLGLAALTGIAIAFYSASKGMASLIEGMNIAYDVPEKRGFIRKLLVTMALTVMVIIGLLVGLFATVVIPAIVAFFTAGPVVEAIATVLAWLILGLMTVGGLTVLYRFGPSRLSKPTGWFDLGAVVACILWLFGSAVFGVYVANFGSYNESFGALAGVVVLLTWLWLSAYIVLFGAELNSEIDEEHGLVPASEHSSEGQSL